MPTKHLLAFILLAGCIPQKGARWDDDPRAGRDQCDYAGVHVKGLKTGAPLDDTQTATWRTGDEYSTFMDKCQHYSSQSVQCLIDAPTVDAIASCK